MRNPGLMARRTMHGQDEAVGAIFAFNGIAACGTVRTERPSSFGLPTRRS